MTTRWYDRSGNPIGPDDAERELSKDRTVRRTILDDSRLVSTVFMVLDHRFRPMDGEGKPILWETMVFASVEDRMDQLCRRYTSEADAIAGHEEIVLELRRELARSPLRRALARIRGWFRNSPQVEP